jgi:hypothetical protein
LATIERCFVYLIIWSKIAKITLFQLLALLSISYTNWIASADGATGLLLDRERSGAAANTKATQWQSIYILNKKRKRSPMESQLLGPLASHRARTPSSLDLNLFAKNEIVEREIKTKSKSGTKKAKAFSLLSHSPLSCYFFGLSLEYVLLCSLLHL